MYSGGAYLPLLPPYSNPIPPSSKINHEDESAPLTGGESSNGPNSGGGNEEPGSVPDKFELTNISVIGSSSSTTNAGARGANCGAVASGLNGRSNSCTLAPTSSGVPRGSIARDFIVTNGEEKGHWTNFHFVMCVGIVGFFVFWIVLLCRMYLPAQFQMWIYGTVPSERHGGKLLLREALKNMSLIRTPESPK